MIAVTFTAAILMQSPADFELEVHRVWAQERRDYQNARAIVQLTNNGASVRGVDVQCDVLDGERIVGVARATFRDFFAGTTRTDEAMAHRVPRFDSVRCRVSFVDDRPPR